MKSLHGIRVFGLVALLSLTGCGSGEPSESEMLAALPQSVVSDTSKLQKVGCEKMGDEIFKCGIASKKTGVTIPWSFKKVDGKWVAMSGFLTD